MLTLEINLSNANADVGIQSTDTYNKFSKGIKITRQEATNLISTLVITGWEISQRDSGYSSPKTSIVELTPPGEKSFHNREKATPSICSGCSSLAGDKSCRQGISNWI